MYLKNKIRSGLLSHSYPFALVCPNTPSQAISVIWENCEPRGRACDCPNIANQLTPELTPEFLLNRSVELDPNGPDFFRVEVTDLKIWRGRKDSERPPMLKHRKLLILRSCKTAKNGPSAEVRYTAGTRIPKTPGSGATGYSEAQSKSK